MTGRDQTFSCCSHCSHCSVHQPQAETFSSKSFPWCQKRCGPLLKSIHGHLFSMKVATALFHLLCFHLQQTLLNCPPGSILTFFFFFFSFQQWKLPLSLSPFTYSLAFLGLSWVYFPAPLLSDRCIYLTKFLPMEYKQK